MQSIVPTGLPTNGHTFQQPVAPPNLWLQNTNNPVNAPSPPNSRSHPLAQSTSMMSWTLETPRAHPRNLPVVPTQSHDYLPLDASFMSMDNYIPGNDNWNGSQTGALDVSMLGASTLNRTYRPNFGGGSGSNPYVASVLGAPYGAPGSSHGPANQASVPSNIQLLDVSMNGPSSSSQNPYLDHPRQTTCQGNTQVTGNSSNPVWYRPNQQTLSVPRNHPPFSVSPPQHSAARTQPSQLLASVRSPNYSTMSIDAGSPTRRPSRSSSDGTAKRKSGSSQSTGTSTSASSGDSSNKGTESSSASGTGTGTSSTNESGTDDDQEGTSRDEEDSEYDPLFDGSVADSESKDWPVLDEAWLVWREQHRKRERHPQCSAFLPVL